MLRLFSERLTQGVLVLLIVSGVAFALFQFVGDPVSQMLPPDASAADRAALAEALGLNDSAFMQYVRFLENAVTGEFGLSLRQGAPVTDLILERLPATVELATLSVLLALVIGIPIGVHTALYPETPLSRLFLGSSLLGMSLPTFLIGILLILGFSVFAGLLPAFGRGETVEIGFWTTGLLTIDGLKHLVLPVLTLGLFQTALVVRLVRGEMLEVLRRDFVKFAKARGLKPFTIAVRHALRNASLPVIAVMALQFGEIIAFSVVTETVFQWPGMGMLFLQSVQFADIPVLAAYLTFIALLFVVINALVDLSQVALDPRLRKS